MFAVIAVATPASAGDEYRHYRASDNWCYREEPLDCLWQNE
jgi:hypothetical protein